MNRVWAVVVMAVCAVSTSFAQERDSQLWAEFDIEVPLIKKLAAIGTQEFRLYDDMSTLALYRTEAGMEYKLSSFLRLSALYRIDVKSDEVEHTSLFNSTAKTDVGPIELSWRLRWQRDFFPDSAPEDVIRNKFSIDFEGGKIVPYIAAEIYYYTVEEQKGFNRFRWYAGIKREIDKHQDIEIYYLLQRAIGRKETELTTVLGLGYGFSF